MYRITFKMSVLMAGVAFSAAALAVDAPSAPVVAAPAATVEASASQPMAPVSAAAALPPTATIAASAPVPTAPVSADAALAPAANVAVAAEAPKAEEKEPALSQAEGLALLKASNCLLCHSIEKKVVGPAYKDVAAKYRGQTDVEAKLFAKITKGGKGVWGSAAMPAQPAKPENIKSLIKFVLALPPVNVANNQP